MLLTLVAKLYRLAGTCPLCGNTEAENNKFHTKCPEVSCKNYDVQYSLKVKSLEDLFG